MPQASAELRQRMEERFGDPVSDSGAIAYLTEAGYTLNRQWCWEPKPGVSNVGDMTREEFECLLFLVHEWDFGGLADPARILKEQFAP